MTSSSTAAVSSAVTVAVAPTLGTGGARPGLPKFRPGHACIAEGSNCCRIDRSGGHLNPATSA